jgi:hypothetical protein
VSGPRFDPEFEPEYKRSPLELLCPPPFASRVHFYPRLRLPQPRRAPYERETAKEGCEPEHVTQAKRCPPSWARLIYKVYHADPLVCRRCGGRIKVVGYVHDTVSIRRILEHLGLSPPLEKPPPQSTIRWSKHLRWRHPITRSANVFIRGDSYGGVDLADAEAPHSRRDGKPVSSIPVTDEESRCGVPGEGVYDPLSEPLSGGVRGRIGEDEASASSLPVGSHPLDLPIRKEVVIRAMTTSLVARRTLVRV